MRADWDSWGWNTPGLWQDRADRDPSGWDALGLWRDRAGWGSSGWSAPGLWWGGAGWGSSGWNGPGLWQDRPCRWQDKPRRRPDTRVSAQPPVQPAECSSKMTAALEEWPAFSSSSLLWHGGLEEFARRSYNAAAAAESLPDVLLSHLPPDPRKLAIGSSATISIKNLTQRHRGVVRELSSSAYWSPWEGKVPASACHPQLIGLIMQWQPASGGSEPASDSRQRQPAPGGSEPAWGCNMQLYMRVAKVFSLMDLFVGLGAAFTADALYKFYLRCPLIARRRKRGSMQSLELRRRNAKIRRLNSTTATTYFSSGRWPATPSISFLQ